MRIVAISGQARHGKDTAAQFLKDNLETKGKKVVIMHYADLLKYICTTFLGWDGEKDEKGRSLLQHVGTDIVRNKRPNFWVDFIGDILELFNDEWDYVIISDARFPNEINRLKERGFDVIHVRVKRIGFENSLTNEQKNHLSETAMNNYPEDVLLINESLKQLEKEVNSFASALTILNKNEDTYEQLSLFEKIPYAEGA